MREEHELRVFEDRILRKIFGPERDELMGEWRRLHNEELYDLYATLNIIRDIKSRRMKGACSTYGGRVELHTGFLWGNLRARDHLEDLSVDGRIILKCLFKKWIKGH